MKETVAKECDSRKSVKKCGNSSGKSQREPNLHGKLASHNCDNFLSNKLTSVKTQLASTVGTRAMRGDAIMGLRAYA